MFLYILIGFAFVSLSKSHTQPYYRADYEYNSETYEFYKLHTEAESYFHAILKCALEGAKLIKTTDLEIVQAHSMLRKYPEIGKYVWVDGHRQHPNEVVDEDQTIDLSKLAKKKKEIEALMLIDQRLTTHCTVLSLSGKVKRDVCSQLRPYICKVEQEDMIFNGLCNVYGTLIHSSYQYVRSVGSCYRVRNAPLTWDEAYADCNAEGAHLVVINSEAEQQAVWNIVKNVSFVWMDSSQYFFAGFRVERSPKHDKPQIFKTIFNQTLDEAGYNNWTNGEPKNLDGNEHCGAISKEDGKFQDQLCINEHSFVCEKEIRRRHLMK